VAKPAAEAPQDNLIFQRQVGCFLLKDIEIRNFLKLAVIGKGNQNALIAPPKVRTGRMRVGTAFALPFQCMVFMMDLQ